MPHLDLVRCPPRVAHANRYPFRPAEVVGPHASASELFLPVLAGAGVIEVDGVGFALAAGDCLHVPWAAVVRYRADRRRPFDLLGVHLAFAPWTAAACPRPRHVAADRAGDLPRPRRALWDDAIALRDVPRLGELGLAIVDAYGREDEGARDAVVRANAALLVAGAIAARARATASGSHPHAARIAAAQAWMERMHARPIARRELARRAGLGETAFAAAFDAVTGRTPMRWLIDLRLARASALLRATRRPIAEIAAAVGIGDRFYFARVFRRRLGCTPSAYRRRQAFGGER